MPFLSASGEVRPPVVIQDPIDAYVLLSVVIVKHQMVVYYLQFAPRKYNVICLVSLEGVELKIILPMAYLPFLSFPISNRSGMRM